jgi:hypothetical protein
MKSMAAVLIATTTMMLGACASAPPADNAAAPKPAAPVAAAAPATPAAKANQTARLDPNETVCRRQQTTGSRFGETRCQTRYQWEVEQRNARKQVEDNQKGAPPPTN